MIESSCHCLVLKRRLVSLFSFQSDIDPYLSTLSNIGMLVEDVDVDWRYHASPRIFGESDSVTNIARINEGTIQCAIIVRLNVPRRS